MNTNMKIKLPKAHNHPLAMNKTAAYVRQYGLRLPGMIIPPSQPEPVLEAVPQREPQRGERTQEQEHSKQTMALADAPVSIPNQYSVSDYVASLASYIDSIWPFPASRASPFGEAMITGFPGRQALNVFQDRDEENAAVLVNTAVPISVEISTPLDFAPPTREARTPKSKAARKSKIVILKLKKPGLVRDEGGVYPTTSSPGSSSTENQTLLKAIAEDVVAKWTTDLIPNDEQGVEETNVVNTASIFSPSLPLGLHGSIVEPTMKAMVSLSGSMFTASLSDEEDDDKGEERLTDVDAEFQAFLASCDPDDAAARAFPPVSVETWTRAYNRYFEIVSEPPLSL
jgi:hypothetical protein